VGDYSGLISIVSKAMSIVAEIKKAMSIVAKKLCLLLFLGEREKEERAFFRNA
jgi:DNA topoisomerase VI subunit B